MPQPRLTQTHKVIQAQDSANTDSLIPRLTRIWPDPLLMYAGVEATCCSNITYSMVLRLITLPLNCTLGVIYMSRHFLSVIMHPFAY